MRPPNKEEFSKLKVVLDCMPVVIVKVLKKTLSLIRDLRRVLKLCRMLSKKASKSPSLFGDWRHQLKFKVLIVFRRSEAPVKDLNALACPEARKR